jgi:hypothetical protein
MKSFLNSAVKLSSASEHRPYRMLTVASLELALSMKIDLNISLVDVGPFRLFRFTCHARTKTYLDIYLNQFIKLMNAQVVPLLIYPTLLLNEEPPGRIFSLMASVLQEASCDSLWVFM